MSKLTLPSQRGTFSAALGGMMTFIIILLALVAAGLITELIAADRAPFGYEDEQGFHFGNERSKASQQFELENPS